MISTLLLFSSAIFWMMYYNNQVVPIRGFDIIPLLALITELTGVISANIEFRKIREFESKVKKLEQEIAELKTYNTFQTEDQ